MRRSTDTAAERTGTAHRGRTVLAGLAGLAVAGGVWMTAATTAVAPEPAKLKAALPASTGASASAVYAYSAQSTSVRYYSSSWTFDTSPYAPAVGTPCSSSSLVADALTSKTIQMMGNYRRCA